MFEKVPRASHLCAFSSSAMAYGRLGACIDVADDINIYIDTSRSQDAGNNRQRSRDLYTSRIVN